MRKPKAERGGVASRNHMVPLMRELRFELKDHTIMCDTMANWWFQFKVYTIARAIYTYFGSEFGLIHVSNNLFWMSIFRYKCTHTLKNIVIYILISAYTLVFVQNIKNSIFTNKENPRRKGINFHRNLNHARFILWIQYKWKVVDERNLSFLSLHSQLLGTAVIPAAT